MEEAINEITETDTTPIENPTENDMSPTNGELPQNAADEAMDDGEGEVFVYDAEADLSKIRELFPQLSGIKELGDIECSERFVELRQMGLSVREALLATNGTAKARATAYDNRSHLKSFVPRSGGDGGIQMSRAELSAARELFGSLTEREIKDLYRRVRN